MTCNPNWREIVEALEPGQSYADRPDVVCRVFRLKLQELLHDLREGVIFKDKHGKPWKTKYIMHVVEFQKRGKPHAHIYMRFTGSEEDMPRTPEDVDRLISAKLPVVTDCKADAALCKCMEHRKRAAVQNHMMHTCARGACLPVDGPRVCKRKFPKAPCATTTQDDGGYPIYSRGECDDMVVSHNIALLLKYDCHINVELASTVWVIKYMVRALDWRGAPPPPSSFPPCPNSHFPRTPPPPPPSPLSRSTSTCTRGPTPSGSTSTRCARRWRAW